MSIRERHRLWQHYCHNVRHQRQYSLRDIGVAVGDPTQLPLAPPSHTVPSAAQRVQQLLASWSASDLGAEARQSGNSPSDEQKVFELCLLLLEHADNANESGLKTLLDLGIPVNFQHPLYLETALHITCSRNTANALTTKLLKDPQVDLLLRDQFGRRPWNNAVFFGIDTPIADEVRTRTLKQAVAEGWSEIEFYETYRKDLAYWISTEWYSALSRPHDETQLPR